ncbi:MAG: CPBP family intramembrane metalloprotease [Lachnospiraceae bacterium]|nr:CPBP family intramembrane metalloprotease [Lachnospiraceae bacterium]
MEESRFGRTPDQTGPQRPGILKRIWLLIYPMLVYEGVALVVTVPFMILMIAGHMEEMSAFSTLQEYYLYVAQLMDDHYLVIAALTCVISIPIMLLFMRMDRKKERAVGMAESYEPVPWYIYGLTFVCGAAVCITLNNLLDISGLSELLAEGYEPVAEILYQDQLWLEILCVGILTPIVEELIFRGLVYRRLRWMTGVRFAIFLSALYFGFFHGNWLQGIYAFAIGLLLAYSYEKYHTILAPITIHIGANLISVLASETSLLDFVYGTEDIAPFMILTGVSMALLVITLYWIITGAGPAERADGLDAAPEGPGEKEA